MFKLILLTPTPNLIYMKNVETRINPPWIPACTGKMLECSWCFLYRWNRYLRFKRSTRQWPHTPTHPLLWNEFSALSWGNHCGTGTTIQLTFRSWLIFIQLFCSTPYILYIFITSAVTTIPQKILPFPQICWSGLHNELHCFALTERQAWAEDSLCIHTKHKQASILT